MKRYSLYQAGGWQRLLLATAITAMVWSLVLAVVWL